MRGGPGSRRPPGRAGGPRWAPARPGPGEPTPAPGEAPGAVAAPRRAPRAGRGARPARGELARARAGGRHVPDSQLRYATVLGGLGPALDGAGSLAEADAWYCILEGTREPSVAQAQAMALTELAARAATAPDGEPRVILLAADDYSAVAGRVPISNLYERGRALGIGVQVSAQTWQGLGRDDDERYRITGPADGGVFVLRTSYPEPLTALAGHRRVLDTAHKLVGNIWADEPRREPDPVPPAWPQRPASLDDFFGPGGPR